MMNVKHVKYSKVSTSNEFSTSSSTNKKYLEFWALVAMLFSALFFSCMNVFVKLVGDKNVPATQLVSIRAIGQGFVILLGLYFVRDDTMARVGSIEMKRLIFTPFGGTRDVVRVVVLRGVLGGMGFVSYFYTVNALPIGDAITLMSLFPIVSIFLGRIFLSEPIVVLHLFAALGCIVGATLIARPPFLFGEVEQDKNVEIDQMGYLTAGLGTIFGGCVFVLMRKAGTLGVHTLQLLFSWAVFGLLFAAILGNTTNFESDDWVSPKRFDRSTWLELLGLLGFGILAHFLMNWAGTLAPAGLGAIFRSSDIVYAYFFEIVVFSVTPRLTTYIGVVFVILSVFSVGYHRWRSSKSNNDGGHDEREDMEDEEDLVVVTVELNSLTHDDGDTTENI